MGPHGSLNHGFWEGFVVVGWEDEDESLVQDSKHLHSIIGTPC